MENTIDELQTVGDFIRWGASQFNKTQLFFGHGTDNAIDEAILLTLHTLHLPKETPEILWQSRLTYQEKSQLLEIFQERIEKRLPTPYLTHEAWFANLRFYVDDRVLIPRSPIAELIEERYEPWIDPEVVTRMLDLCTGSGCIAIASALLAFPNAEIDAVDISCQALEVADHNIESYGLEKRVYTVFSDLFTNLKGIHYDLIVSNPPYADAKEISNMPEEYHHEPMIGLEAGEDGLFFVKRILREAFYHLTPNGILIVEVGASQEALIEYYPVVPFTWLEFKHGGAGVFILTAEQLHQYAAIFEEE